MSGNNTYLVLLTPKSLKIAPARFIHGIGVTQIRSSLVVLPSSRRVFCYTPPVPEAVGQLEHGQNELAFCNPSFLDASTEGLRFDRGGIGCCGREIGYSTCGIYRAAPSMSRDSQYLETRQVARHGRTVVRGHKEPDSRDCLRHLDRQVVRTCELTARDLETRSINIYFQPT